MLKLTVDYCDFSFSYGNDLIVTFESNFQVVNSSRRNLLGLVKTLEDITNDFEYNNFKDLHKVSKERILGKEIEFTYDAEKYEPVIDDYLGLQFINLTREAEDANYQLNLNFNRLIYSLKDFNLFHNKLKRMHSFLLGININKYLGSESISVKNRIYEKENVEKIILDFQLNEFNIK